MQMVHGASHRYRHHDVWFAKHIQDLARGPRPAERAALARIPDVEETEYIDDVLFIMDYRKLGPDGRLHPPVPIRRADQERRGRRGFQDWRFYNEDMFDRWDMPELYELSNSDWSIPDWDSDAHYYDGRFRDRVWEDDLSWYDDAPGLSPDDPAFVQAWVDGQVDTPYERCSMPWIDDDYYDTEWEYDARSDQTDLAGHPELDLDRDRARERDRAGQRRREAAR